MNSQKRLAVRRESSKVCFAGNPGFWFNRPDRTPMKNKGYPRELIEQPLEFFRDQLLGSKSVSVEINKETGRFGLG